MVLFAQALAVSVPLGGQEPKREDSPGPLILSADEREERDRMIQIQMDYQNTSAKAVSGGKAIYGKDDRKDVLTLPEDDLARKSAWSTCLLTSKQRVKAGAGGYELQQEPYRVPARPQAQPCKEEKFREQTLGGWCSGFLVGEDLVATAGHCCSSATDAEVRRIAFVFGFFAPSEKQPASSSLKADQVYFGKKLVQHSYSGDGDFALIQLDRPVTLLGAAPLKVRREGEPLLQQKVGVVGNPCGLPTKAAFGDNTAIYEILPVWLRTNLDTYGGNSGSAVFGLDGTVEGILVQGVSDFLFHDNGCFYSYRLKDDPKAMNPGEAHGEWVTRASVFAKFLPGP